jgi:hypothetical protein
MDKKKQKTEIRRCYNEPIICIGNYHTDKKNENHQWKYKYFELNAQQR